LLHVDCIAEALRITQDNLDAKNFYAYNPAFDKKGGGCRGRN
jgi:spore coat protein JC